MQRWHRYGNPLGCPQCPRWPRSGPLWPFAPHAVCPGAARRALNAIKHDDDHPDDDNCDEGLKIILIKILKHVEKVAVIVLHQKDLFLTFKQSVSDSCCHLHGKSLKAITKTPKPTKSRWALLQE